MENHYVSLEIAKELNEGGWKKKTEFGWIIFYNNSSTAPLKEFEGLYPSEKLEELKEKSYISIIEIYPAPLATEILEELPARLEGIGFLKIYKFATNLFAVSYANIHEQEDKSLPNALAKMWLYLRKKK